MKNNLEIVPSVVDPGQRAESIPQDPDPDAPAVGKWYWVKKPNVMNDIHPYLGCVVEVGSNYAEVEQAGHERSKERIHLDHFWTRCARELHPEAVIAREIQARQGKVVGLMKKVQEITSRLAITPGPALAQHSETQALALRGSSESPDEYKAALVRAKDEELPELFRQIESANYGLAQWMSASLIPLKAKVAGYKPAIEKIKERIFSVELYAGLTELVEQVADGEPAPLDTKVHLFQRRHYMDEECLANYKAGGMTFKSLRAFDGWLAKKENLDRIMPYPRCLVAFQVRRNEKHRTWSTVLEYFKIQDEIQLDRLTFLYIRNGEQLFRLSTSIEFDHKLFPDVSQDVLGGKIYAEVFGEHVQSLISEAQYLGMVEEEEREEKERKENYRKASKKDKWRFQSHTFRKSERYVAFNSETVYYDDILKHIQAEMNRHNRLVLVLQGLLDRSMVLHPHPPWSLWNADSFKSALELVYDESRTLTSGEAPDFEAYRAKCNESLRSESVTVGQQIAWERMEAKKEYARRLHSMHGRSDWRPERYQPPGNPGPGWLAHVHQVQPKARKVTFAWNRERQAARNLDDDGPKEVRCTFSCKMDKVLNVSAYKPGDFKLFFSDPRTRADYLKWAPLLLEAEEYHAGNRTVLDVPPAPKPKAPSWEGQRRYAYRKQRQALMDKAVRLVRDVTMKNKTVYKAGSLWRVRGGQGSTISVIGINEDGTFVKWENGSRRAINNLDFDDVRVDASIPDLPKKPDREDMDDDDYEDD